MSVYESENKTRNSTIGTHLYYNTRYSYILLFVYLQLKRLQEARHQTKLK